MYIYICITYWLFPVGCGLLRPTIGQLSKRCMAAKQPEACFSVKVSNRTHFDQGIPTKGQWTGQYNCPIGLYLIPYLSTYGILYIKY